MSSDHLPFVSQSLCCDCTIALIVKEDFLYFAYGKKGGYYPSCAWGGNSIIKYLATFRLLLIKNISRKCLFLPPQI